MTLIVIFGCLNPIFGGTPSIETATAAEIRVFSYLLIGHSTSVYGRQNIFIVTFSRKSLKQFWVSLHFLRIVSESIWNLRSCTELFHAQLFHINIDLFFCRPRCHGITLFRIIASSKTRTELILPRKILFFILRHFFSWRGAIQPMWLVWASFPNFQRIGFYLHTA